MLPRIQDVLDKERTKLPCSPQEMDIVGDHDPTSQLESDAATVLFKNERMYRHNLARFNYTTYDVRRAQDVINPNTSHCDIMLLADSSIQTCDETRLHHFLYARVLGIYHVNVVYTGKGSLDYAARKIYFLWVRWFQTTGPAAKWSDLRFDSLSFPPMARENSFGFVDPSDVLRACHVVPAFASGKVHSDSISLSLCANDSDDYRQYYVNRFVPPCLQNRFIDLTHCLMQIC